MKKWMEEQLEKLEYQEQELIKLRYGLCGGYQYTDLEIMDLLKISIADLHCMLQNIEKKLGQQLPQSPFPHEGN